MLTPASTIALIGFGPQAAVLAAALAPRGCALRAFDPAPGEPAMQRAMRRRIEAAGVDAAPDLPDALRGARLVVCDIAPPDPALSALLVPGQVVLDLADGAMAHDARAALVAAGGAQYLCGEVEAGGTEAPARLLIAGERAATCAQALSELGMPARVAPWKTPPRDRLPLAAFRIDSTNPTVPRGELP